MRENSATPVHPTPLNFEGVDDLPTVAVVATVGNADDRHPCMVVQATQLDITECKHCSVPVDTGDSCTFCSSYTPPETAAQRLDVAVNRVDLLRHDLNEILRELPTDAPLFAVADLTIAVCHLRRAAVLIDKASDQLEAVQR